MDHGADVEALGRPLRSYSSDNRRRLRHGVGSLVATVILVPFGVLMWILDEDFVSHTPNPPSMTLFTWVGSACFGMSVLLLPYGFRRLVQGIRHKGERIDVYEGGFVHHRNDEHDVAFQWRDITTVDARGIWQPGKIGHAVGIDYRCIVRRSDGAKVVINSFFPAAIELTEHIGAAVDGPPR